MKLVTFSVIPAAVILSALSAVVHTAPAAVASCDLHSDPCDGTYIISDEPGMSRFYVHEYGQHNTPWKRVSNAFYCGSRPCSKRLTIAEEDSTIVADSQGKTFTVGESHDSDAETSKFAEGLKVGFGASFNVSLNDDHTFTWTPSDAETDDTGFSSGKTRTYRTDTGTTLTRTDTHTCRAKAGEKFYLAAQRNWLEVKGNYCVFDHRNADDDEVWSCKFLHAKFSAVMPDTTELDGNLKCVTEKDGETE